MSGFGIVPPGDRGRHPTLGEDLDFRLELDDETFDALSDRIGVLEAQVMILSDLVTTLTAMTFGLVTPE